jgi:pimeloyl-ACP methyl ester carboxylesterase
MSIFSIFFRKGSQSITPHNNPKDSNEQEVRIDQAAKMAWRALCITLMATAVTTFILSQVFPSPLLLLISMTSAVAFTILFAGEMLRRAIPYMPVPIQKIAYVIQGIVSEILSFFVVVAANATYSSKKDNFVLEKGKTPVLLIHGYLHNHTAWLYHRYRLKNANIGPIYTINLGSPLHSIEDYAQIVSKKIKEIGCQKIDIVGHSMGGVVGSYYATNLADNDNIKVNSVTTIGSPLLGTRISWLGIGECTRQMRFGSPFITELLTQIKKSVSTKFYHIGSNHDCIIIPCRSANPDYESANNTTFNGIGHLALLYSDSVADRMITLLQNNYKN